MATYEQLFTQAVEKGVVEELTLELIEWSEDSPVLFGKLLRFDEFTGGMYEQSCMRYTFDTDDGRKSAILGSVGDRALAFEENIGRIFRIQYKGKQKGKSGKPFNNFSIQSVPLQMTKKKL